MAQGGLLGNGTGVAFSETSPHSWTQILQVRDVTFPTYEADRVNIDTHSRTNKLHRTLAGMITVGDPGFTVLNDLNPATDAALDQLREWNIDGTSVWWRFEVPVNREKTSFRGIEFLASVASFNVSTPIADVQTAQIVLAFDGDDIYWDAAAGATEF